MTYQKFHKGDLVAVRPFAGIDKTDIGRLEYMLSPEGERRGECYSIPETHIDSMSAKGEPFEIISCSEDCGTWVYRLRLHSTGDQMAYFWAQGMLEPFHEEEIVVPADKDELFETIFS